MDIYENLAGKIKGRDVIRYQLINDNGFQVNILNYGGIITDIITPDKNGNMESVVLKYKNLSSYEINPSYLGAIIGRTSGRICDGKTLLNGKDIILNKNYGIHQGHGGNEGFSKQFWECKAIKEKEKIMLTLYYFSHDNEENYPGNLAVRVDYIVTNNGEFSIKYYAKSDEETLVNMTNHSYFNLSGNVKKNILNHILHINSDYFLELDKTLVPKGNLLPVDNTPFDFRVRKEIGKDINSEHNQIRICSGYDHPWILNNTRKRKVHMHHKTSGRALDIFTEQKAIVAYSMNFPDDESLSIGRKANKWDGICIETQSPPIGRNNTFLDYSILKKGELYKKETIFKFYIKI